MILMNTDKNILIWAWANPERLSFKMQYECSRPVIRLLDQFTPNTMLHKTVCDLTWLLTLKVSQVSDSSNDSHYSGLHRTLQITEGKPVWNAV